MYEIIEKNKPKAYSEVIDQIIEMINKNREKSEKKQESRLKNKEKKGLLVRKDTAEMDREKKKKKQEPSRVEKKQAAVEMNGKVLKRQGIS